MDDADADESWLPESFSALVDRAHYAWLPLPDAARWERLRQMGFDAARANHDLMVARGFVAKPAAHERERETAAVSAIRL